MPPTRGNSRQSALIAGQLGGEDAGQRAWRLLAILSGAAGMARAVDDAKTRAAILAAARQAATSV